MQALTTDTTTPPLADAVVPASQDGGSDTLRVTAELEVDDVSGDPPIMDARIVVEDPRGFRAEASFVVDDATLWMRFVDEVKRGEDAGFDVSDSHGGSGLSHRAGRILFSVANYGGDGSADAHCRGVH